MAEKEKQQEQQEQQPQDTGNNPDSTTGKQAEAVKTFTQEEMNAIIKDRLDRERDKHKKELADKYGDYDTLKDAASKWQQAQDEKKSDLEKMQEALSGKDQSISELHARLEAVEQERTDALIRAKVVAAAVVKEFKDPEDAYRLIDLSKLSLEEDGVKGIGEALDTLAEAKPYLLRSTESTMTTPQAAKIPTTNPARGGKQGETDEQRRQRIWGRGNPPFGTGQGGGLLFNEKGGATP